MTRLKIMSTLVECLPLVRLSHILALACLVLKEVCVCPYMSYICPYVQCIYVLYVVILGSPHIILISQVNHFAMSQVEKLRLCYFNDNYVLLWKTEIIFEPLT